MKADGAARRARQILRIEVVDHQEDLLGMRRRRRRGTRSRIMSTIRMLSWRRSSRERG